MNTKNMNWVMRRFCSLMFLLVAWQSSLVSAAAAANFEGGPLAEAASAPGLAGFLDERGQLSLPPGFSGSLDPVGFDLISGPGEAPRFAAAPTIGTVPDDARWANGFRLPDGCNGEIHAIAASGSGEIYVGGYFTLCGDTPANNIVRYDPVTGTWSALGSGGGNGTGDKVRALAVSGSDLFIGGEFSSVNVSVDANVPANRVARWDGSAWSALGSGGGNGVSGVVYALAASGNDLYVGGTFLQANIGAPITANRVARWNGSDWSALGNGGGNGVGSLVLALAVSGGELFVGGGFTQVNIGADVSANRIARWDGNAWSALGSGGGNGVDAEVLALAISGGDLYVGGVFSQVNAGANIPASRIARWNGSAWSALGSGGGNGIFGNVNALVVSGGDLYVGGSFTQANVGATITANRIARWNGSAWSALGSGGGNGLNDSVQALTISGSNLYVGGQFITANIGAGVQANSVAHWSGSDWNALGSGSGSGVNARVLALAVAGNDLYVGGNFTTVGGIIANRVAHWNGSAWSALGSGGGNGISGSVNALALYGGDLYVGGLFFTANVGANITVNRIARWDGSTWSAVGSGGNGVNGNVRALAVYGGALYVGGTFTQANIGADIPTNRIARWDGGAWSAVGSGGGNGVDGASSFDGVFALAVSHNDLYVGGSFTQANLGANVPANRVARWDGSAWSALGSGGGNGVSGPVNALAISGSDLYVGGNFFQANVGADISARRIARWDGNTWSALGSGGGNGVSSTVLSLAVSGSDLYVSGFFIQANVDASINAQYVARWNGSTWAALGSGVGISGITGVWALAQAADTFLYVGGEFGSAGGKPSSDFARYSIGSPLRLSVLPATVLVGSTSAISTRGGLGSGAVTVTLSSGMAFCSLSGSTLTALAQGECIVTATKSADGVFPEQTDQVLVRPVTEPGVNLVVEFNPLPPGGAVSLPARGPCQESDFRVSVRNNGPLDAANVRLQMPSPSGLLPPVDWFCVLANGQCVPENGQGAVDTLFALNVGVAAEIDLSACPDPNAAFADFQFRASLPNGTLLFPTEAQGTVSAPLNNEGLFRTGFE